MEIFNMLKKTLFLFLFTFSAILNAESLGYEKLSTVQATQNPDKVEVIEFFWYGCPHCYSLEPVLDEWLKNKPENVEFIRQPAIFNKTWGQHAKAYFTAEVLGIVDKVHSDLFDAIQNKKQKLTSEDDLAKFFIAHGVTDSAFRDAYNSFPVDMKLRKARSLAPQYGITGVPAIIINGKYKTSGPLAKSQANMIKVMNDLIEKESSVK